MLLDNVVVGDRDNHDDDVFIDNIFEEIEGVLSICEKVDSIDRAMIRF